MKRINGFPQSLDLNLNSYSNSHVVSSLPHNIIAIACLFPKNTSSQGRCSPSKPRPLDELAVGPPTFKVPKRHVDFTCWLPAATGVEALVLSESLTHKDCHLFPRFSLYPGSSPRISISCPEQSNRNCVPITDIYSHEFQQQMQFQQV